jgi:hypothetical protein
MKYFNALWILNLALGIQVTIYHFSLKKDLLEYGFSQPQINMLRLLIHIPWTIKPVPALFCVDGIGIFGYHRKPHILIGSFFATIFVGVLISPNLDAAVYVSMLTLYNIFLVLADVAIDGAMIDNARVSNNVVVNADAFRTIGFIIGEDTASIAWERIKSEGVYAIVTAASILLFLAGLFMTDHRRKGTAVDTANGVNNIPDYDSSVVGVVEVDETGGTTKRMQTRHHYIVQMGLIRSTLTNFAIFNLLIVSFISSLIPSSSLPMFYYLTEELKFSPSVMAILGAVSSCTRLLTLLAYRGISINGLNIRGRTFCRVNVNGLRTLSIRTIFIGVTIVRILVNVMPAVLAYQVDVQQMVNGTMVHSKQSLVVDIGMDPVFFSIGDTVFEEILDTLQILPLKQIIGHVCENGVEAGVYASAMSILNIGNALQNLFDTGIMKALDIDHGNYDGLFFAIIISIVCTFGVLILACFLLPDITDADVVEQRNHEKTGEFLAPEFTVDIPQEVIL